MALFRNSLTYVWLFLVGTTLVSWWLGATTAVADIDASALSLNFTVTVGIILIAVVKTRFVIWHFMEVRHGPSWLRWTCDSWLAFLAVMVIALYRYSM
ncbi:MAG TPA: cytochrome C oxidase subunit IV family protein [Dongiaceae bacterium]|nr:cytochrome C oxidase subunit IV family protein [Dongiaceae bacterium]